MTELLGCGLWAVLVGAERRNGLAKGLCGDPHKLLAACLTPQSVEVVRVLDPAVAVREDQIQRIVHRFGFDALERVDDELQQDYCPESVFVHS
ncbi:hypothetical protein ACQP0C_31735 [Nocardia sp. CA-129566]|uniref:hypothetical protein n=1 Tax=Nocardia sp. CA-129566 TaxID=3239976 RepID=UPI003D97841E